jgi:(2R)-ethylmalonyl-CoA mutase
LRTAGAGDIPVVVGGIIPPADAQSLRSQGVAAVFTPRDFGITAIIGRIVDEIRLAHKLQPWPGRPASLAGVTQPASTTTMEG